MRDGIFAPDKLFRHRRSEVDKAFRLLAGVDVHRDDKGIVDQVAVHGKPDTPSLDRTYTRPPSSRRLADPVRIGGEQQSGERSGPTSRLHGFFPGVRQQMQKLLCRPVHGPQSGEVRACARFFSVSPLLQQHRAARPHRVLCRPLLRVLPEHVPFREDGGEIGAKAHAAQLLRPQHQPGKRGWSGKRAMARPTVRDRTGPVERAEVDEQLQAGLPCGSGRSIEPGKLRGP